MIFAITYGLGCASFLILTAFVLLNYRRSNSALAVSGLYAVTAAWAAAAAFQQFWSPGIAHIFEDLKTWAWLQFMATMLVVNSGRDGGKVRTLARFGLPALGLVTLWTDADSLSFAIPGYYSVLQSLERVFLSILGILIVENLVRNTIPSRKWHVTPFALAAGTLFAYDLFVFAEALFVREADAALLAGRGIVLVLVSPLLLLSVARNRGLQVNVHISRRAAFHSTTLVAGGIFLLVAGTIASVVGTVPGSWGPVLRVAFFSASVLVLFVALSTESFRAQIRHYLIENFFSSRYDYRVEWERFVDSLSASDDVDSLYVRAIRAMAKVIDSPGGILLLANSDSIFHVAARLNVKAAPQAHEEAGGPFLQSFEGGTMLRQFGMDEGIVPAWASDAKLRIAIPLVKSGQIAGIMCLLEPRAGMTVNWESLNLLRLLGRQVASYLSEERLARSFAESSAILAYNNRFAFVVHDIKNLASQLGMTVANARRFGANPEFRSDMIHTIENSVARLNALLGRLRTDTAERAEASICDPAAVARSVLADFATGEVKVVFDSQWTSGRVNIDVEALRSVLTHLISNAVEASLPGDCVILSLVRGGQGAAMEIRDQGKGMDADFIRDELFSPLRSTKRQGHGIGAFQARELLRAAGSDLAVVSAPGKGTTMRFVLREQPDGKTADMALSA